tara:strand:- start:907 stop:1452 length:546 start_codon:yes stop_codon:yes gene_type:complete
MSEKITTFEQWKEVELELNGFVKFKEPNELEIEKKYVNISDYQYRVMMDTLTLLYYEYDPKDKNNYMVENMSEEEKTETFNYITNIISSLELYRITWTHLKSLDMRDLDGVPSNIVRQHLSKICDRSTCWVDNTISNLMVNPINEDDKTSNGGTIGEYYRTEQQQLMKYRCDFKTNDDNKL